MPVNVVLPPAGMAAVAALTVSVLATQALPLHQTTTVLETTVPILKLTDSFDCVAAEVHPTVIWAKFAALRDGAQIASRVLWR